METREREEEREDEVGNGHGDKGEGGREDADRLECERVCENRSISKTKKRKDTGSRKITDGRAEVAMCTE
jgi:hypothetical protein